MPAGFEQAVKDSNQSDLGRRNGGNMVSAQASERALLCYLVGRLHSLDADVLVGHNVAAFDLDILLHRLQHHKVVPQELMQGLCVTSLIMLHRGVAAQPFLQSFASASSTGCRVFSDMEFYKSSQDVHCLSMIQYSTGSPTCKEIFAQSAQKHSDHAQITLPTAAHGSTKQQHSHR